MYRYNTTLKALLAIFLFFALKTLLYSTTSHPFGLTADATHTQFAITQTHLELGQHEIHFSTLLANLKLG